MINAIYIKLTPKSKWRLFSRTVSAEAAISELVTAKQQAISAGYEEAESAVQIFDTALWIPEYLREIKDEKLLFN
jgi:hypothetical protein